jgi:hypothetical protein
MRRRSRPEGLILALAAGLVLVAGRSAFGAPPTSPARPRPAASAAGSGDAARRGAVPSAGAAVAVDRLEHVVGSGTPASCTSAGVVAAVARGGVITFDCGPGPVTITMTATAKVVNTSHQIVLDGGGKVTLSGAGERQILYMNTCDKRQQWTTTDCYDQEWPELVVENLSFIDGNATVSEAAAASVGGGGGGAIFDLGGRLKVVDSHFIDNRCHGVGPDLGGGAIRALAQWHDEPVYITDDTFVGGQCSNGGALSSIGVSWVVLDSVMRDNHAIGYGANPASAHTPGGGSGGAIYCDGDSYSLVIEGSVLEGNTAREGGGAIFFVSDDDTGTLTIAHSTLRDNPSAGFWTRPYPGVFFESRGRPDLVDSALD